MSTITEDRKGVAGRGRIGTMTAMPALDDESYLDFVEGLRAFAATKMSSVAAEETRKRHEAPGIKLSQIKDDIDRMPVVAFRNRMLQSTQGMNWLRVLESYGTVREELEAELTEFEGKGPGTLDLVSDWTYPEYYDAVHYHRQPGGYHDDPLAGYIYHYGTKVFHLGRNDKDEAKESRIFDLPVPQDGSVKRALDVACSVGAGTTAFKKRWPDAEVWGIDASGPLLRYAHARAVKMGVDVNFSQQLAESLRFPDEHFDLVYMSTLLHEQPVEVGRKSIAEARRVMRPGAVLVVQDMSPAREPIDPWADYNRDFDTRFNCEPYSYNFIHSGLDAVLEKHFSSIECVSAGAFNVWTCVA